MHAVLEKGANDMNIVISMEHPAWVHQFKYMVKEFQRRGDAVTILAVDKDGDLELLREYDLSYHRMADGTGNSLFEKAFLFLKLCVTYTAACKRAEADILIGRMSPMMAVAAFLLRKPHVVFEDTEASRFSLAFGKIFSTIIITPKCFMDSLGKKQIRASMYKEMFYLDNTHFTPDRKALEKIGIDKNEKYIVVRFVGFKASHDFGKKGLNDRQKYNFVRRLSKYVKVYISSEMPLSLELEAYRLKCPYHLMHQVLYYAQLVISDGTTVVSEAVVLGTHAIGLCPIKCGTTYEQEKKYHLLKNYAKADVAHFNKAAAYAKKLLKNQDLWKLGKVKRKKLFHEMENCSQSVTTIIDFVQQNFN